jgi:Zn-dependent M28 family amino/carboxypeptidase
MLSVFEMIRPMVARKAAAGLSILVVLLTPACRAEAPDPSVAALMAQVSEREILATAQALQDMHSRAAGRPGNTNAAAYLLARLAAIPGVTVEYQDERERNVVGTLRGTDPDSQAVYLVGAHYDSTARDPGRAPGATDNAAGCTIVLDFARILSRHPPRHTVKFGLWNGEETGLTGSASYAAQAAARGEDLRLYINFDSVCHDPRGRMILDVITDPASAEFRERLAVNNRLYGLGFELQFNRHDCGGDHTPFIARGYKAVMLHQEDHAFQHTADDTVDKITPKYAARAAELCLSLLAPLAGCVREVGDAQ